MHKYTCGHIRIRVQVSTKKVRLWTEVEIGKGTNQNPSLFFFFFFFKKKSVCVWRGLKVVTAMERATSSSCSGLGNTLPSIYADVCYIDDAITFFRPWQTHPRAARSKVISRSVDTGIPPCSCSILTCFSACRCNSIVQKLEGIAIVAGG